MKIEILGTCCPSCLRLEKNVRKALGGYDKKVEIVKVTDIAEIMGHGIMSTPALVVDGKVKSYGKVNSVEEIKEMVK